MVPPRVAGFIGSTVNALSALMPQRWREALNDKRTDLIVDVSGPMVHVMRRASDGTSDEVAQLTVEEATSERAPTALAGALTDRDDKQHALLRLPEAELLRKSITLPVAASRNLNEIVRFEIDRLSPLEPEQVHFDSRVVKVDHLANKIEVQVRIFKKTAVQVALDICVALGLQAVGVEFSGVPAGEKTFPLGAAASRYLHWRTASTPALSLLACGLAVAVLAGCEIRNEIAGSELHDRVADARLRAHASGEILRRMSDARDRVALLVTEKQRPSLARVVADVTQLVPDGAWITQFEKTGNDIHIRGFSPNASRLVEIFERSPRFAKAHFRAPLIKSEQGNLDQFDLAFALEGAGP